MIVLNSFFAAMTFIEVIRLKRHLHVLQKDAMEGGRILYKAVIALKMAVTKLTEMTRNDIHMDIQDREQQAWNYVSSNPTWTMWCDLHPNKQHTYTNIYDNAHGRVTRAALTLCHVATRRSTHAL